MGLRYNILVPPTGWLLTAFPLPRVCTVGVRSRIDRLPNFLRDVLCGCVCVCVRGPCLYCPSAPLALQHGGFVPRKRLAAKGLLNYLAINEFGFRRIWRIKQIEEDVIHRGRRSGWITPSESCLITGVQPKAGTGLKMQTVSVVFSTLHC